MFKYKERQGGIRMIKKQMKQLGKTRRKMISLILIVALVITALNLGMMRNMHMMHGEI